MAALSNNAFILFRKYIYEQCGIDIDENKSYLIETRLSKLLIDSGLDSFEALYTLLERNRDARITAKVIDAITTNETFWFRNEKPWQIMEEEWLPKACEVLRSGAKKRIRIWSAAASTGQEIYSTVMCIDNYLKLHNIKDITLEHFEFYATDISSSVIDIARNGMYDSISIMRGLPGGYKQRYFTQSGHIWSINDYIKKQVKFETFNLQNSFIFMGKFDLIFCRYVLIYFSDELKTDIFKKMIQIMNKESMLFIGTSEIYYSMDSFFKKIYAKDSIYYMPKEG